MTRALGVCDSKIEITYLRPVVKLTRSLVKQRKVCLIAILHVLIWNARAMCIGTLVRGARD